MLSSVPDEVGAYSGETVMNLHTVSFETLGVQLGY